MANSSAQCNIEVSIDQSVSRNELSDSEINDLIDIADDDVEVSDNLEAAIADIADIKAAENTTAVILPFSRNDQAEALQEAPAPSIAAPSVVAKLTDVEVTSEPRTALVKQEGQPLRRPPTFGAQKQFAGYNKVVSRALKIKPTAQQHDDMIECQMDTLRWIDECRMVASVKGKYADLIAEDGRIDMGRALEFANDGCLKWNQKADILGLNDFEQMQCCYRSTKITDRCNNAKKYADKVEKKLKEIAKADWKLAPHIEGFVRAAHAEYLCKGWPKACLPVVYGWLTDTKPMAVKNIMKKIAKMNKWIA